MLFKIEEDFTGQNSSNFIQIIKGLYLYFLFDQRFKKIYTYVHRVRNLKIFFIEIWFIEISQWSYEFVPINRTKYELKNGEEKRRYDNQRERLEGKIAYPFGTKNDGGMK